MLYAAWTTIGQISVAALLAVAGFAVGRWPRRGQLGDCSVSAREAEVSDRYRQLFELVPEAAFVATPQGRLLDVNPALVALLGYDGRRELLNVDIATELFVAPTQRETYLSAMAEHDWLRNYEIELRRKDGRVLTLLENSFASRDAAGRLVRLQGFLRDITEKKRADQAILRRNLELGALHELATFTAQTFDLERIVSHTVERTSRLLAQDCDILLWNADNGQPLCSRSSHDEDGWQQPELGELARGLTSELENAPCLWSEESGGMVDEARDWFRRRGRSSFVLAGMLSHGKLGGLLAVSNAGGWRLSETDCRLVVAIAGQLGNAVERVLLYEETVCAYDNLRQAQEQLLQTEKLAAVGQFISGVAHELNNPLAAVIGYAQLLEGEALGEPAQDFVQKLYRQAQRLHGVVENLLAFSRQRKPRLVPVELRRVLEKALDEREFDLRAHGIVLRRNLGDQGPLIAGNVHHLEQVFVHIVNNALDAMSESATGGELTVRLVVAGRVGIEFADNGPGLAEPGKVFEPFYTTKKVGKGRGLGLSICYGIIREHGGEIQAGNGPQGGAVFQIWLPPYEPAAQD